MPMFKKYYDYILALILSLGLTSVLTIYLNEIEISEAAKDPRQISLENLSHRWNDLFYPEHGDQKPNQDVVLVAIDERSIIEVGTWPWNRAVLGKVTEELHKYGVKTLAYDIIFSEKQTAEADASFVRTISKIPEKLIFGTYSDYATTTEPYQDFCLTQAFLHTGGASLAKINPYFSVDDQFNPYEEIEFNQLFKPIFHIIDRQSVRDFLSLHDKQNIGQLTQFQLNTLAYFKKQYVYDYCKVWLTDSDTFGYRKISEIKEKYFEIFKVNTDAELEKKITDLKKSTLRNSIPQYAMWKQNIDEIQDVALYTGAFLVPPDTDGIIRNYPLVYRTGNQLGTSYIPSLSLQSYLATTGYQALFKIENEASKNHLDRVEIHDVSGESEKLIMSLPVNYEGKLLINYYGKQNTIPYISAKELLNDSEKLEYSSRVSAGRGQFVVKNETVNKADFLKDKNVILGATAIGVYDIRTTPNDISYPGPEIHATVLSNLFNKQFLAYDKYEVQNSPVIFFIFILISLIVFLKSEIRFSAIYYIVATVLLFFVQYYNYARGTLFHSSLLYFVLLFSGFFMAFIYKYFFQSKKSKKIKMAFSKYVSKDVVEEILKNESAIELRGQKLNMTVFFSDIRGFTEFSEKMDPVELSELLNRYFTPMSAIITRNQGTIDKYIGDAIMAMFGAPINYKDHAVKACAAALECVAALQNLNTEFTEKNWPRIEIGIGINTGLMNVGNIGSETIQNYTVIGDNVNLASRLEALNKTFGTHIIISEYTYKIIKDRFKCRELGQVNVKGKKEPVRIYELQDFIEQR